MYQCNFCKSSFPKNSEINLCPILLNQLTKYEYISELVELEKKSHCTQEFEYLLENSKEPKEGTNRSSILGSKNSIIPIIIVFSLALLIKGLICK